MGSVEFNRIVMFYLQISFSHMIWPLWKKKKKNSWMRRRRSNERKVDIKFTYVYIDTMLLFL